MRKSNCLIAMLMFCSSSFAATECKNEEPSAVVWERLSTLSTDNYKLVDSATSIETAKKELLSQYKACLKSEQDKEGINKKISGLNWGVALAFMSLNGKSSITDATVIDGVVRINKEHSRSVALMLETHYLVRMPKWKIQDETEVGIGPFVAIRVADVNGVNNTASNVSAYGTGLMLGFSQQRLSSWNIGVGYFVDTQVKALGSGLAEGQPLPGTETAVRFKETDSNGWMFLISGTF